MFAAAANFPGLQSKALDGTAALWLQTFKNYNDDLMATALQLALLSCKYFPTVADLQESIAALGYEKQILPKVVPAAEKKVDLFVVSMLEQAAAGQLPAIVAGFDITKLKIFAHSIYPSLSDQLIRQNFAELTDLMAAAERCGRCHGVGSCPDHGFKPQPCLLASGSIVLEYVKCSHKDG